MKNNLMKYISIDFKSKISAEHCAIKSHIRQFPSGEWEFLIQENIANQEITIFQQFEIDKINEGLIKLLLVCDTLKRNHVKKITLYVPFLPYTRQDRTYEASVSLGSKLVADLINLCGIHEVVTYDLHALQIEGFFQCKVQNLSMMANFIDNIKKSNDFNNTVIVFPDAGAASRYKRFFNNEDFDIAIISKNRIQGKITMKILGNVRNKNAIIVDDMVDGGGTLIEAANVIQQNEANKIDAYAVHGLFSGNAIEKLNHSILDSIHVSDSIYPNIKTKSQKIHYHEIIPIEGFKANLTQE